MDPGRYGFQQGWDNNNSALEGYGAVYEPNFRVGGSYDERRFLDERYSRDNVYPRNSFHHDILDRDNYPPPPPSSIGIWPQSRRRSCEEEFPLERESRQYEKQFVDPYHEMDTLHDPKPNKFQEFDKFRDGYRNDDNHRDYGFDKSARIGRRDRDDYARDDYDYRSRISHSSREDSRERANDYGRHSYDSDYDGGSRRDGERKVRGSRDRERDQSLYRRHDRERDQSPHRRYERSRSRGRDDHPRSRSPRGRSYSGSHREDSFDDARHERSEKRRDREEKRQHECYSVAPSPTVVVKGLSLNSTEEDLYQILAEWGPLRHVRVIKERNSGTSRGFAFIDFPSLGAACAMMDKLRDDGLVVDGRKLFFEYSSKPTGGAGGSSGPEGSAKSGHGIYKSMTLPSDWMCTSCGYINFARRTSCFQCNEVRSEDAPPADISSSNPTPLGKKGSQAGPTHVLVVRGLDDNADEEMLRYEFSKHAPIKDLRLVRDKFTHVSRGFAFVHFHSVEDASKALEATNGTTLEKNGQILRVAYAKSILGPGSGALGSQSSSLAAAAIEAATFAQQYDAVGWAPKEYNPDDNTSGGHGQTGGEVKGRNESLAPQSGFVWDEASGYYYDAASGCYYDGNTGLYYDGNSGVWYSYDQQKQQYIPCTGQHDNKTSEASFVSDGSNDRKVVIAAPATTASTSSKKGSSLPDAVQAAATAAIAAEKKEKEKSKEIKLALKSSILANKKKMNNVLTMWKQRSHEGQAPRVALDENPSTVAADDKPYFGGQSVKTKAKTELLSTKENSTSGSGVRKIVSASQNVGLESPVKPRPVCNSLGGSVMGFIRGSGRGVVKSDTSFPGSNAGASNTSFSDETLVSSASLGNSEMPHSVTPFKTDTSALGSYTPPVSAGSGKRRFSEMPLASVPSTRREQPLGAYRDRAAERRSLYGSSSSTGDDMSDVGFEDSNRDFGLRKGPPDAMPFPPGVGGRRSVGDAAVNSYEVITADKAIDENNLGNRMLRGMGWHEGQGLGRDGSGMTEPVQAQAADSRAGLGSRQKKPLDPSLEVQAGDSYKTLIHKKALARFREMS